MALFLFSHFSLGLGGAGGTLIFSGWASAQAQGQYRTDSGLGVLLGAGYGRYASTSMFGEGELGQGPFFRTAISKDLGWRCCGGPPGVMFGFTLAAFQEKTYPPPDQRIVWRWRCPWAFQAGFSVPLVMEQDVPDSSWRWGQIYTTFNLGPVADGFTLTSVGLGLDLWLLNWK